MVYRDFGDTIIIRLDPGDDIHQSLAQICEETKITGGSIFGLGVTSYAKLHAGDPEKGTYGTSEYAEKMELVNLTGNVGMLDGKYFPHLHAILSGAHGREVFAGHLDQATIRDTAEIFLYKTSGTLTKKQIGQWYFWDM